MYYYQLALRSAPILVVNKYEQSSKYNGEWTEANEAWFKRQANSIYYYKLLVQRLSLVKFEY